MSFCGYQLKLNDHKPGGPKQELQCPQCHKHIIHNGKLARLVFDKNLFQPSAGITTSQLGIEYRIDFRWFKRPSLWKIFNSFVSLIVCAIAIIISYMTLLPSLKNLPPTTKVTTIAVVCFLAFIILMLMLRRFFNHTSIILSPMEITHWHWPFSLEGKTIFKPSDIMNFSIERKVLRDGNRNRTSSARCSVRVHLKNGREIILFRTNDLHEAAQIEKLIETRMTLVDEPSLDQVSTD